MYDATSEPHEFFGANRDEAVAKACAFFGRGEAELDIRDMKAPEVSGLGPRTAVVAWPQGERPRGDRSGSDSSERGPGGRGAGARCGRGEPSFREAAEPDEDLGPSKGTVRGSVGEIGQFILGVVERMEVGPFEVSETDEADFIIYQVSGAAAHRLTSGEGKAQDALQLLANQAAATRKLLRRWFQHSFTVAKQVRTDTSIGNSPVSVAFAAVTLARQIFSDLSALTVLLIGAGETVELAARHLHQHGVGRLVVANRTVERALMVTMTGIATGMRNTG